VLNQNTTSLRRTWEWKTPHIISKHYEMSDSTTPGCFNPRKMPLLTTGLEAGFTPQPLWTLWKRTKSFVPMGINIQFLVCPARSLVTIPTDLFWLILIIASFGFIITPLGKHALKLYFDSRLYLLTTRTTLLWN